MTISLKHAFAMPPPDDVDPNTASPSDWNAEHVLIQAGQRMLGKPIAGVGATVEMTSADVAAFADVFIASGASHAKGEVPDPGAAPGTTKFLREDASWAVPPAGGTPADLQIDKHVLSGNFTITAGWAAYITRYLEIPVGFILEIGADGDLEIG